MAFGTAYMHALVISVQKKGENPTDKCFPSKLEIFAPQKNGTGLLGALEAPMQLKFCRSPPCTSMEPGARS